MAGTWLRNPPMDGHGGREWAEGVGNIAGNPGRYPTPCKT